MVDCSVAVGHGRCRYMMGGVRIGEVGATLPSIGSHFVIMEFSSYGFPSPSGCDEDCLSVEILKISGIGRTLLRHKLKK